MTPEKDTATPIRATTIMRTPPMSIMEPRAGLEGRRRPPPGPRRVFPPSSLPPAAGAGEGRDGALPAAAAGRDPPLPAPYGASRRRRLTLTKACQHKREVTAGDWDISGR